MMQDFFGYPEERAAGDGLWAMNKKPMLRTNRVSEAHVDPPTRLSAVRSTRGSSPRPVVNRPLATHRR
ncbi:MAG: hypothetical protein ACI9CF_000871 [Candidatus Omnitrophota bacterium]|jgi:hypothetical protein